jgi:hypothetical protein
MPLNTQPNLANPDAFYAKLVELHADRSEEHSRLINASLILLLANHIGDGEVLEEAMRLATEAAEST